MSDFLYKSVAELAAAYRSSKLGNSTPAIIDNDLVSVWDNGEIVFEMHPSEMLPDALQVLGIPCEPA